MPNARAPALSGPLRCMLLSMLEIGLAANGQCQSSTSQAADDDVGRRRVARRWEPCRVKKPYRGLIIQGTCASAFHDVPPAPSEA